MTPFGWWRSLRLPRKNTRQFFNGKRLGFSMQTVFCLARASRAVLTSHPWQLVHHAKVCHDPFRLVAISQIASEKHSSIFQWKTAWFFHANGVLLARASRAVLTSHPWQLVHHAKVCHDPFRLVAISQIASEKHSSIFQWKTAWFFHANGVLSCESPSRAVLTSHPWQLVHHAKVCHDPFRLVAISRLPRKNTRQFFNGKRLGFSMQTVFCLARASRAVLTSHPWQLVHHAKVCHDPFRLVAISQIASEKHSSIFQWKTAWFFHANGVLSCESLPRGPDEPPMATRSPCQGVS